MTTKQELFVSIPTFVSEKQEESADGADYAMSCRAYTELKPVDTTPINAARKAVDRLDMGMVVGPIGCRVEQGNSVPSADETTEPVYVMDDVVPVPKSQGEWDRIIDHCQIPIMVETQPPVLSAMVDVDFGRLPSPADVLCNHQKVLKEDEMVLAISAEQLISLIFQRNVENNSNFVTAPFLNDLFYLRRDWCESDERFVQMLPYMVFYKILAGKYHIYVYQRTKTTGEQRLAKGCSIGLGGHINPRDFLSIQATYSEDTSGDPQVVVLDRALCDGFWSGIVNCMLREGDEEVAFADGTLNMKEIIQHNMRNDGQFETPVAEYIYSKTTFWLDYSANAVERSHLGMFTAFEIPEWVDVTIKDPDLNCVGFIPLSDLVGEVNTLPTPLECWSQSIIDSLDKTLKVASNTMIEGFESRMYQRKAFYHGEHTINGEQLSAILPQDRWAVGTLAGIFKRNLKYYAMNLFMKV